MPSGLIIVADSVFEFVVCSIEPLLVKHSSLQQLEHYVSLLSELNQHFDFGAWVCISFHSLNECISVHVCVSLHSKSAPAEVCVCVLVYVCVHHLPVLSFK